VLNAEAAAAFAIARAKKRGAREITPDDLLIGCLRTVSRFGIVQLGVWGIDLEALGTDWLEPAGPKEKVAYSQETVDVFDRAARVARADGSGGIGVYQLLAAFAGESGGLMGELKRAHGITSATWRAGVAQLAAATPRAEPAPAAGSNGEKREFLTPEEAAEAMGVHVQTLRAYIRSGKLPALRLAGERALRVRRKDLEKLLEPLTNEE
jgi:excisionase family DNA binding protein